MRVLENVLIRKPAVVCVDLRVIRRQYETRNFYVCLKYLATLSIVC